MLAPWKASTSVMQDTRPRSSRQPAQKAASGRVGVRRSGGRRDGHVLAASNSVSCWFCWEKWVGDRRWLARSGGVVSVESAGKLALTDGLRRCFDGRFFFFLLCINMQVLLWQLVLPRARGGSRGWAMTLGECGWNRMIAWSSRLHGKLHPDQARSD